MILVNHRCQYSACIKQTCQYYAYIRPKIMSAENCRQLMDTVIEYRYLHVEMFLLSQSSQKNLLDHEGKACSFCLNNLSLVLKEEMCALSGFSIKEPLCEIPKLDGEA